MRGFIKIILVILLVAAAFLGGRWYDRRTGESAGLPAKSERKILYYHDPMHPSYRSDRPGIAPDCGMKLEPVYADEGPGAVPAAERKVLYYHDPLDTAYRSDKPGLNPETGNDLEPVYDAEGPALPPGTFQVSSEKQQLIGVRYGKVEVSGGMETIRAVGKVAADERLVAHVHSKVEGWIEKVFVDFTGKLVKQGDPLLTVYSPEMLATQQEFLLAGKAREVMRHSTMPAVGDYTRSLLDASRKRLELWDFSETQIDDMLRTGKPVKSFTVHSPASGFVAARNAFSNQKIMPETELYTIIDLSRVWILAEVFEHDAPRIRIGQPATVRLSYQPGRSFQARATYIYPEVDAGTRTLKVRLEAENPGYTLKPEMYVDVDFRVSLPAAPTVPAEAVFDTGLRQTVFVDLGNGFLEPRQVSIGRRTGDVVQILSGLKPGEKIVVSGNFLLDSESQLKSTAAPAGAHQHEPAPKAVTSKPAEENRPDAHGDHRHD